MGHTSFRHQHKFPIDLWIDVHYVKFQEKKRKEKTTPKWIQITLCDQSARDKQQQPQSCTALPSQLVLTASS